MEHQNPPGLSSETNGAHEPQARRVRGRGYRTFAGGLVLGVLGAGVVGFAVGMTHPGPETAFALAREGHRGGPPTLEEARDHAEFAVAFALHRLGATQDQQQRVQAIVEDTVGNLFPLLQEHRADIEALRTVLAGETVDRAAIEKLRLQESGLADRLSRVIAAAIGDTAEVLSAEQRAQLVARLDRFHHRR